MGGFSTEQRSAVVDEGAEPLTGRFKRSVDELPAYALVNNSQRSGKLHRPMMGGRGDFEDDEVRPACQQGGIESKRAENDPEMKYTQNWKVVAISRRLPFAKYGLCQNPGCFRHVELVEEEERSRDRHRAGGGV